MESEQKQQGLSLSIVIPAYNEYPGITDVLNDLNKIRKSMLEENLYSQVDIIVVDDGSQDKTADAVREVEGIQLYQMPKNSGYGAALKAGFALSQTDHCAFLDADGTYPPVELIKLSRALQDQQADIVVGSRLAGEPSDMPVVRFIGNKIFAKLTSWVSGTQVSDCASGMRVFRKDVLKRVYPLPDGLNFTPAMTTRSLLEELNIVEVPMAYHERYGSSKLNAFNDGFRFLNSIVSMTTLYNPLKFFVPIGLFLLFLGIAYGIEPVYHYVMHHEVPERFIYRLIAILAFWLAGLQIVMLGILANISLGIIHRKIIERSKLVNFFLKRTLFNRMDIIGGGMVFLAIFLNKSILYEYFTKGFISSHWSYIVTGAVLMLTGVQLITVHVLIRILSELREREREIQKDLVECVSP